MVIKSVLDSDMYKFSMQQAVLELFPNEDVEYRFKNRGKQKFTPEFLRILKHSAARDNCEAVRGLSVRLVSSGPNAELNNQ